MTPANSFVRLTLENFRRFAKAEVTLAESGLTLISGPNGSGKSTLLESVYLLCLGRPARDIRVLSLLCRTGGSPYFRVEVERAAGEPKVRSVAFLAGSALVFHEDGRPVRRSDLIGRPPVVLFSAEEMRMVTGEPARRRKWMDRILAQENPEYLSRLRRYTRALEDRNAFLRAAGSSVLDEHALLAYDETLAGDGGEIMSGRRKLIEEVQAALPDRLASLGAAHLAGRTRLRIQETAAEDLLGALISHRAQDRAAGHTTVGPHRDDVLMMDVNLPAQETLSQGEIRILSLALKCIEAARLSRVSLPILLFDDLFSELDEERRAAVTAFLTPYAGQALVTTCLPPPMDLLAAVRQRIDLKNSVLDGI